MKKLSLVLGFAFMASMVFAQNTATVNQTGSSHKANVAQDGSINSATVDQLGTNNTVSVDTKGANNFAVVEQNGSNNGSGAIPVSNMGFIKQDGDQNVATLKEGTKDGLKTSFDGDGLIDQKGNKNEATLLITGQYMNFTNHGITQIQQNALGVIGNTALITQTSYNSDMDVHQTGSENMITGTTLGQNNQYFVDQIGKANNATVSQTGSNNGEFGYYWGWNPSAKNWNILSQTGDNNIGSVLQASDSRFKMTQMGGNSNEARIEEQGLNTVTTMQNGNSNIIGGILNCVTQDVAIFAVGASMDATQLGDNNKLWVSTAGALTVVQDNTGTDMVGNTIKYSQTAAGVVELKQIGDENLIWLKNTSANSPMDVEVEQEGNGNTVASFVGGVATSCATFAGSHLDVDQYGNLNSLNLDSQSAGASVDVLQSGNSNWASVVQSN